MNDSARSNYPEMGAILIKGGTAFRVWAAHADEVFVTGSSNN